MESNSRLRFRFGNEIDNPSSSDIENALKELFIEDDPNCTEADYEEHPDASLTFGHDHPELEEYTWTVYSIEAYRGKSVYFSKYFDQDDDEPQFELKAENVQMEDIVKLWTLLSEGNVEEVRELFETLCG